MEWLTAIRTAIGYMEGHLGEAVGLEDVAREVHLSPFFLQRGFSLMTGYGIGEYLRNRRLYEAALICSGARRRSSISPLNTATRPRRASPRPSLASMAPRPPRSGRARRRGPSCP